MFISPAFASDAAVAVQGGMGGTMSSMLPLFLVVIVFYFMVIRPQNQRIRDHRKLIDGLKKGDKVVTGGGIIATIVKAPEGSEEVVVKIADGIEVTVLRTTIISLRDLPQDKQDKK
jgi:preprotein translocase subunit YajC